MRNPLIPKGLTMPFFRCLILVYTLLMFVHSICFARDATVRWTPNSESDLAGYKIYYKAGSATLPSEVGATGGLSPIYVQNVTTATLTGLDPYLNYYLAATAYNYTGVESLLSDSVVFYEVIPPTVSITSPAHNEIVIGKAVAVHVIASDASGIAKVEFYVDNVLQDTKLVAPFSFSWNTVIIPEKTYSIIAKAYDGVGNTSQTDPVQLVVVHDLIPPTVSVDSPIDSAHLRGTVSVSINASDNTAIDKVELYANSELKYASNSAPYTFSWNTGLYADNLYNVYARAYDTSGNMTDSSINRVTVDNTPPTISITSPVTNPLLRGDVMVSVTATDNVGIDRVELYANNLLKTTSNSAPYALDWNSVLDTDGAYSLFARAFDKAGNTRDSAKTGIILDNTKPTLTLNTVTTPTVLSYQTLSGTVNDNLAGSTVSLKVGTAEPVAATISGTAWSCDVTNLSMGNNSITATATDRAGNKTEARSEITRIAPFTNAKVYLDTDDSFTVSNSGAILYGNRGNNTVTIDPWVTGVVLDQNIERINFSGASSSYAFRQTGNIINVYDASGIILLVKAPVQGDSDGTVLSFSDGTASTLLAGGVMTLGGVTVSPDLATPLTPEITPDTQSPINSAKAKVFLGTGGDNFTVSSSGTTLYGNVGYNAVTISTGVTDVTLDQNIERINFSGPSNNYTFKQTGNIINVHDANTTLIVKAPVQGDSDGTLLGFSDGVASALVAKGVMTLGGAVVSSSYPRAVTPTLRPVP